MVLTVDEDMLETRRSHNELTNQIHAHWRPESSNLNQGHFMRGQKRPDDVPPTLDAWLTFGGVAGEESGGVVDAFASMYPDLPLHIHASIYVCFFLTFSPARLQTRVFVSTPTPITHVE